MKVTALAAIVAVALSVAGAAMAAEEARDGHKGHKGAMVDRLFERYDLDGDGRITRAEVEQVRAERAAAMDADGDGYVSRDEFVAAAQERAARTAERRFDRVAEDGRIAVDDFGQARVERMFERIETAEEGVITRDDLANMRRHRR